MGERERIIELLKREDIAVLKLAFAYAENMYLYGIDVIKAIDTATENREQMQKVYEQGYRDGRASLFSTRPSKEQYYNFRSITNDV